MATVINVLIFGSIFVLIFKYSLRTRSRFGVLDIDNKAYNYQVGDDLISYGIGYRSFRGLSIELPKQLPQIYLDSTKDVNNLGPRVYIDKTNKLDLEGDFQKYFQAYVPAGSEAMALSILTPDLMQVIIEASEKYDVEFYKNQLRVISPDKIFKKLDREKDILNVGEAILQKLQLRLKSWSDQDSSDSANMLLKVTDDQTIRLGSHRLRATYIAVIIGFLLPAIAIWLVAFKVPLINNNFEFKMVVIMFGALFAPFGLGIAILSILHDKSKTWLFKLAAVFVGFVFYFLTENFFD